MEILVCPPQLLDQVRQALPCSPAAVPWLSSLQAITEDPTENSRGLLGHSSTQMDLIESLFVSMVEPEPWGSVINPSWAAHLVDVEEAWDQAAATSAVPPSGEFPLSPQLYSPRSTHASIRPVPTMVDPSPGEHAPDRPSREFEVNHSYLTLPSVSSSAASVPAAECPEYLLSALVDCPCPSSVICHFGS